ncbi:desampylase [Natronorarus salvus]|uniref:desampylase n=1 Tax=Natronorarus salvus TaxID=3117733 RepID=UPI002F25FF81
MRTLSVPGANREAMIDQARAGAPEEVCGVLGGRREGREATVGTVIRVPNVASEPRRRYELDAEGLFAAIERIEGAGDSVVGFYHSHPAGPPAPSATDRALASWPGRSYVIVSLAGPPSLSSWCWDGERFREERVASVA